MQSNIKFLNINLTSKEYFVYEYDIFILVLFNNLSKKPSCFNHKIKLNVKYSEV